MRKQAHQPALVFAREGIVAVRTIPAQVGERQRSITLTAVEQHRAQHPADPGRPREVDVVAAVLVVMGRHQFLAQEHHIAPHHVAPPGGQRPEIFLVPVAPELVHGFWRHAMPKQHGIRLHRRMRGKHEGRLRLELLGKLVQHRGDAFRLDHRGVQFGDERVVHAGSDMSNDVITSMLVSENKF